MGLTCPWLPCGLVVQVAGTMVLQPSWDLLPTHRRLARLALGDRVHPLPHALGCLSTLH